MRKVDRHRAIAFLRFTARRFIDDRCQQSAGALACTTLFAMVPLTAALIGILSGFPAFAEWQERITFFIFENFVPATGEAVRGYLTQFADNANKATALGIIVLIVSTLMLMLSIEDAFNRIWRVPKNRPVGIRIVMYWTVLSLGPAFLIVALALSTYLLALPLFGDEQALVPVRSGLLNSLPFLIEWAALTAAYRLIPNRSVHLRNAAVGALIGALLFEAAKRAFSWYVVSGANYQQVYGALAVVPIFILWIYFSWVIVLLGASFTASLTSFDYRPRSRRLPIGEEFRGLVRVLAHFAAAQRDGIGLHSEALRDREPFLSDDLVQRYLSDLNRAGMIQRNDAGEWMLTRDLASVSLYDIYAACDYRLPLGNPLPVTADSPSDAEATALLGKAAFDARMALAVPLAEIFSPHARSIGTSATKELSQ
ncbi:MAG: YihY family inner membrane protein [Rudaea sp.]